MKLRYKLLIALAIFSLFAIHRISSDCYVVDGAATTRVYCEILDNRESY
jgi:hypothetical protein